MTESLEQFLSNVRSSCETHAERKGYKESGGDRNVLGELTKAMGVESHHAIGEILAKLVEFKAKPRRVLAEKIAGWAWRLWITAPEQDGPFPKLHYHGDCLKKRADGSTYCEIDDPPRRLHADTTYPEDWTVCGICLVGRSLAIYPECWACKQACRHAPLPAKHDS